MNCPKCNDKLEWRNPGGKAKNLTKRAGVDVLKLKCVSCDEKWLCDDAEHSHPYQTKKNLHYVGVYVKLHPAIVKALEGNENRNRIINISIDRFYELGIY